MRIIKPDAVIVSMLFVNPKDKTLYWHDSDTIEITDAQLNYIYKTYEDMGMNWYRSHGITVSVSPKPSFAIWFRGLLSLAGKKNR